MKPLLRQRFFHFYFSGRWYFRSACLILLFIYGPASKVTQAQLINVSESLHILTEHHSGHLGTGLSLADFNGDYIDDLSFASGSGELKFYTGTGDESGFQPFNLNLPPYPFEAKMVLWCDVNNDGLQDLFITYRLAPNKLYMNTGDMAMIDVSASSGIQQNNKKSYGACFGDFDNDGFNDLFVCNYSDSSSPDPRQELYRNAGDGTFIDITESSAELNSPLLQAFQAQWVDFDDDGLLDIHVVRDRPFLPNNYFKQSVQDGQSQFTDEASSFNLDIGINCMSTSIADYDRDGDLDVFLSAFPVDSNWILINHGSQFSSSDSIHDFNVQANIQNDETSWAGNWLDVDNDGWEDLYIATAFDVYTDYPAVLQTYTDVPDFLHYNNNGLMSSADSSLTEFNALSFSTVTGDFNLDGFPDLISNKVGDYAHILRAEPNENNWFKILLEGTSSNLNGVGSEICIWTADGKQLRTTFCGENYLGQNSWWEHFGLGTNALIDSLEVQWPSGMIDHFNEIAVNQHILLKEGTDPYPLFISDDSDDPEDPENENSGCTYEAACNYEVDATSDDGSCDFTCLLNDSLCGFGTVWSSTLNMCIIADYDCSDACTGDFNGDGVINLPDLLSFLAAYASECSQ